MNGRTRTKEEQAHIQKVLELGCIACLIDGVGYVPAEYHHTDGSRKLGAHKKGIPLCVQHHRAGNKEGMISIHPYKARFEARYGKQEELLKMVNEMVYGKQKQEKQ